MSNVSTVMPQSANLKKAIGWLSETVQNHPEKKRQDILRQAELRFDLTPAECNFLDKNFSQVITKKTTS